jgi:hypothetical protein
MQPPHDSRNLNGWNALPPPSPMEILLDLHEKVGAVQAATSALNETTRDGFTRVHQRINEVQDRTVRMEARLEERLPRRRSSRLKELAEMVAPLRELTALVLLIALGLFGLTQGAEVRTELADLAARLSGQ